MGGGLRLFDLEQAEPEPRVLYRYRNEKSYSGILSIDAKGRWLATAENDNFVLIWDLENPRNDPQELRRQQLDVSGIAFDPLAQRVAIVNRDATVLLWDLDQPKKKPQVLLGNGEYPHRITIDHEGHRLAIRTESNTTFIWNLDKLDQDPRVLPDSTTAFDPRGRWLAVMEDDPDDKQKLHLCNLNTKASCDQPIDLGSVDGSRDVLEFDPEGHRLVVNNDDTLRVWYLNQPEPESYDLKLPELLTGSLGIIGNIAFGPNGRWLAVTSHAGKFTNPLLLWDLHNRNSKPHEFRLREYEASEFRFDPKKPRLDIQSAKDTISIWSLDDLKLKPLVFRLDSEIVNFAYDPKGGFLATSSPDGRVRLWHLDVRRLLDHACRTAGRNLLEWEWDEYGIGEPYQITCEQFPSGEELATKPASDEP